MRLPFLSSSFLATRSIGSRRFAALAITPTWDLITALSGTTRGATRIGQVTPVRSLARLSQASGQAFTFARVAPPLKMPMRQALRQARPGTKGVVHGYGMAMATTPSSQARPRRILPPSVVVSDRASLQMAALLQTQEGAAGMRIGMVNDWGSHTGFTYTLSFVRPSEVEKDDERVELSGGALLFIERRAIWAGEGGLLGAQVDLDESFNLIIEPKKKESPQ